MRKMNFKDIFVPTISLFLICLIVTFALALTNSVTASKIAENEAKSQAESMKIVCPDADTFEQVFENENGVIFEGKSADTTVGYAISTLSSGYGGQIKVMTGLDLSGTIINIDVYYNDDETPGLGKNTSNDDFTSRFKGLLSNDKIVVDKDFSGEGQKVDAVTSSTISSRAVIDAVNKACELFNAEIGGAQ